MNCLNTTKIEGETHFVTSLKVAQLALKRRTTDASQQGERRIIAFIGSPLTESLEDLVSHGEKLKKNSIAIDVINFGEELVNTKKLESFIAAASGEDKNCNLITVIGGDQRIISDILLSSPVLAVDGVPAQGVMSGGDYVDPNADPELAMVLQMSREEEKRRQEKESGKKVEPKEEPKTEQPKQQTKIEQTKSEPKQEQSDEMEMDDDAMLQEAIRLSQLEPQKKEAPKEVKKEEPKKVMSWKLIMTRICMKKRLMKRNK